MYGRSGVLFAIWLSAASLLVCVHAQWTDYSTQSTSQWPTTTPTPSQAPSGNDSCACTVSNIWLDIFFAVDASKAITAEGFDAALAYVQTVLASMTVGQGLGQQTRVGFIFYSTQAVLWYNLTAFQTMDQVFDAFSTTAKYYQGQSGTNIEGAIQLATQYFNASAGHRPNAKRVLVVLASAYEAGTSNDPTQAASTFKEDGSVIITIEYVQAHGNPVPELGNIASPNYQLSNIAQTLQASQLQTLFCYANCFCAKNYVSYGQDQYNKPQGGCYYPELISSIQRLSVNHCRNERYNGLLPIIRDNQKAQFISSLFVTKAQYWVGLTRSNGAWSYSDGTPLGGYSMWAPGYPTQTGDCAYQWQYSGFKLGWVNVDCNQDFIYACQTKACDTDRYCADSS